MGKAPSSVLQIELARALRHTSALLIRCLQRRLGTLESYTVFFLFPFLKRNVELLRTAELGSGCSSLLAGRNASWRGARKGTEHSVCYCSQVPEDTALQFGLQVGQVLK